MPRPDAWAVGVFVALAALAVLAVGGSPPAAGPAASAAARAAFPLCPAVGSTRQVSAADRTVAQAVAVAYVRALQAGNVFGALGFADAGSIDATRDLAREGIPGGDTVQPSAGRASPLAHDPLGRTIAQRCGVGVLAATLAVDVHLGAGQPGLRALLVRRLDRFLVFSLR
jgi:hypothetical protein